MRSSDGARMLEENWALSTSASDITTVIIDDCRIAARGTILLQSIRSLRTRYCNVTPVHFSVLGMDTGAAVYPARDLGLRIMVGYGHELVFNYRKQYWLWCPILPIFFSCLGLYSSTILCCTASLTVF
ncbi:hypothetical protein DFH29DRAFT_168936 [Suillus ampliporus]|nr:hypothetical protein DFH29DRAFT_168936 [Suillus ampliporus]